MKQGWCNNSILFNKSIYLLSRTIYRALIYYQHFNLLAFSIYSTVLAVAVTLLGLHLLYVILLNAGYGNASQLLSPGTHRAVALLYPVRRPRSILIFLPIFCFNCRLQQGGTCDAPSGSRTAGCITEHTCLIFFWAGSQVLVWVKFTAQFLLNSVVVDKAFFWQLGSFPWTWSKLIQRRALMGYPSNGKT